LFAARRPALLALALLLAGCTNPKPTAAEPKPAKPFDGVLVRVACPDPTVAELFKRHVTAWSNRTGGKVEVVPREFADLPTADVGVIAPAELARFAEAGELAPVPESILARGGDYRWDNLLKVFREKLLVWDGKAYALPLLAESFVCLYRDHLFADPKHREAFAKQFPGEQLAPPADWEQYAHAAEYFAGALGGPSLTPLPADAHGLDREYYVVASAIARLGMPESELKNVTLDDKLSAELFSFHYDKSDGKPRITTPGFVAALEWLQGVQKYRPAGSAAEPWRAFRDGKAVLALADLREVAACQEPGSPVRDKFGVTGVPGSTVVYSFDGKKGHSTGGPNLVPYLGAGGRFGVVRKSSKAEAAAWDLLAHLSGPVVSQEVLMETAWGGGPFRYAHTDRDNRTTWSGYGLKRVPTQGLIDAIRLWASPGVINPVLRLRTPDEQAHLDAMVEELRPALEKGGDAGAALKAAKAKWQAIDAKVDDAKRRGWYRLSVSLPR
jgi:ABC-type glycerol-3-phosphate transport system substrate-binding protein